MRSSRKSEEGYALLLVFLMAAIIAITLYNEMPRVAFESQRLREQMLVDRGNEYKRAIQLYYRKLHTYPTKMDDLESSNNVRFLRRRYTDPMTGKDDWRLIHIGPGGVLTDSLVQKQNNPLGAKDGNGQSANNSQQPGQASSASNQDASSSAPADPNAPQQVTGLNLAATRRPSDYVNGQPQPAGTLAPDASYSNQAQPVQSGAPNPAVPAQPVFPGQVQIGQPGQTQPGQTQPTAQNPGVAGQPVFPTQVQPGALRPGQIQPGQLAPGMPIPGRPTAPGQQNPSQPYNPATVNPDIVQPYTLATGPDPAQPVQQQFNLAPTVNPAQPAPQAASQPGASGASPNANPGQSAALAAIMSSLAPRTASTTTTTTTTTTTGADQSMNTSGIAGVASKYKGPSIKIINERQKYQEWEFIYDLKKDKTVVGAAAVAAQNAAQAGTSANGSTGSSASTSAGTGSTGTGSTFSQPFGQAPQPAPTVYTPPSQ